MALHKHLIVIFLACLINSCYAYQFYVGGRAGWVPNPSENYNHWAERMRFQVNDTLVFKYKKGSNSVLVVNKDDYDKCNTNNPIMKMDDGNSIFKFDHSGPFFFISGNKNDCENGSQKLITVVLAIRPPPPATSPPVSPAPSPVSQTPTSSPQKSPATSPAGETPTSSPQNAPTPAVETPTSSPQNAPTPAGETPTSSPQNAPTPSISPATSPAPSTSSPSNSPAPAGEITSPPPSSTSPGSSSTPGSPVKSPPGSVPPAGTGGGNSPPANIQAPTGSKNSAGKVFNTVSAVFVSIIFTIIIISA